jgi:iron complex transport system substrate-binding protein
MNKFSVLALAILAFACQKKPREAYTTQGTISPKYATGFWVEDQGGYRDLFVRQSADSTAPVLQYRLIGKNGAAPAGAGIPVIPVPISSIVCTSTTHIPLLDYLDESEKLIGFTSTQYISSKKIRALIENGLVKELGIDNSINLELLAQLKPSMVMAYSMGTDLGHLRKIQDLGIPTVVNSEYLEQHPLGRAEWIKFMALFFGKEKMADSVFNWIESEYLKAKSLAASLHEKPTVLTGIPYGGTWYLPGGRNYAARFFEDAGCEYLWSNDPSAGFLQQSLEIVFEKASQADYWIGVGSFETYSDLKATDDRFAKFTAWQNKRVYNYNGRIGPTGGNEYLELGYLRPDLVLKDLIWITHPKEFPGGELFFYRALK